MPWNCLFHPPCVCKWEAGGSFMNQSRSFLFRFLEWSSVLYIVCAVRCLPRRIIARLSVLAAVSLLCGASVAGEREYPVLADIPVNSRTAVFLTGPGQLEEYHSGDRIPGTDWRVSLVTGHSVLLEPAGQRQIHASSEFRVGLGEQIPDIPTTQNKAGSRTSGDTSSTTIKEYTYNERDQLVSVHVDGELEVEYEYDANGNRIRSIRGGLTKEYNFSARDRLVSLNVQGSPPEVEWEYDDAGYRISETTAGEARRFHWDGGRLAYETNILGNVLARYDHGPDRLLAETEGGTTRTWLVDGLKTPIKRLNQDGSAYSFTRYSEYGEIEEEFSPDIPRFGFTGHQRGPVTAPELYYAQQRWYNAASGRFISEDPVWGEPESPLSLHRYLYAYANPTAYVDPDGRVGLPNFWDQVPGYQEPEPCELCYLGGTPEQLDAAMAAMTPEQREQFAQAQKIGAVMAVTSPLLLAGGSATVGAAGLVGREILRRGLTGAYLGNTAAVNTTVTEGALVGASVLSGAEVPHNAPISTIRRSLQASSGALSRASSTMVPDRASDISRAGHLSEIPTSVSGVDSARLVPIASSSGRRGNAPNAVTITEASEGIGVVRAEQLRRMAPVSPYEIGSAGERQMIVHPFAEGGSHITTTQRLARFPDSPTFGGPDGLYVSPTQQVDNLLEQGATRAEIEIALGLERGALDGGGLVRIRINDALYRNLRLPDPGTGNIHHRPGTGLTTGGLNEAVIDSPSINSPGVTKEVIRDR